MHARHNAAYRPIFEAAHAQGWRVERTPGGHFRAVPPDKTKPIIVLAGTPSDARAIKNDVARLRRAGLVLS